MARSLTEADPESFVSRYNNAELPTEMAEVRREFRNLEGGRFHSMLENMHKMFCYEFTDDDRREFTNEHANLVKWMGVYALVEDLNRWETYSGVERSD